MGIDHANGKYIMFCDSDDIVDENWCECMFNTIEKVPDAWVVSNVWRQKKMTVFVKQINDDLIEQDDLKYFHIYKMGLSAWCWNKSYSHAKINKYNIRFDENCFMGEDVLFNLQYFKRCTKGSIPKFV